MSEPRLKKETGDLACLSRLESEAYPCSAHDVDCRDLASYRIQLEGVCTWKVRATPKGGGYLVQVVHPPTLLLAAPLLSLDRRPLHARQSSMPLTLPSFTSRIRSVDAAKRLTLLYLSKAKERAITENERSLNDEVLNTLGNVWFELLPHMTWVRARPPSAGRLPQAGPIQTRLATIPTSTA